MPKRSPLVSQHLENVSREVLQKYEAQVRNLVRQRNGVYALYRSGKLYYVGLASNLRSRLRAHLKNRHGDSWDRFSVYLTIGDRHMKELESLVLRIVHPPGNRQRGRLAKSEDLRRQLTRDLRKRQRSEINELFGRATTARAAPALTRRVNGRVPVLSKYRLPSPLLRVRYKRKLYRARVLRDGSIRFDGKLYSSPSLAGTAVIKRPCNGWTFWTYQQAPGDWVQLDTLRK